MPQNSNSINFFSGSKTSFENLDKIKPLPIFSEAVIDYLDGLSKRLMKLKKAKNYPDIITFAFWCRRSNLLNLKKPYETEQFCFGKGVVFHIAPSNVPVNFAYSLVVGLLAGNVNIVRLSAKDFEQVDIICSVINELENEEKYRRASDMIYLIRYPHSTSVTDFLSSLCNVRVIWGGDNTIAEIRKSPLNSRTTEVTFADRYSLCLINSDKYIDEYDYKKTAQDFYNDTYLSDQNACTSPKIIVWFGENVEKAKNIFWDNLSELLEQKYEIKPVQAINKLANFYKAATNVDIRLANNLNNKLLRCELKGLSENITECFGDSGYFYEYTADTIDEIIVLYGLKCQTISYIGLDEGEVAKSIFKAFPLGVDRIVPVGKTMDFSLIWDGYDLIYSLSRKVTII